MAEQLAIMGGPKAVPTASLPSWPIVTDEDRRAVQAVLDRGIFTNSGTVEVPALEEAYREFTGARHCLATNSGTAALHCCAAALDLGRGDEVVVPALTYQASAMFVAQQGATPVFCDVDPATYTLDPASVQAAITDRTKAIVAVHLHGLPADMNALCTIADRHGLAIIEDTAQAHGSTYRGRIVGTLGSCAGTSLNQSKNLPGGEGGLFLTDSDDLYRAARRLRYLGEDLDIEADPPEGRRYWCHGLGWNYRTQELPAAFARSQLRRVAANNETARARADALGRGLDEIPGIQPPTVPPERSSVFHIYRACIDHAVGELFPDSIAMRDSILRALHAEGVTAGIWQHVPLPAHPAFRRRDLRTWSPDLGDDLLPWDPYRFPVANRLCNESIVIGSGIHPMATFDDPTIAQYVAAFDKVFSRLDELASLELHPFRGSREALATTASALA